MTALVVTVTPLGLKCDFKDVLTDFGSVFACLGKEVVPPVPCDANSTINEELIIANPEDIPEGKTEEDLEYLYVKDLNVTDFPRRLRKKFWKLKGIEFDGCNIGELRSSFFEGLDFLMSVKFPKNKLKKLPGRLFRWNFNIRWIEFGGNAELKNVGFNLFKHLRWLRKVDFSSGGCGDSSLAELVGGDTSVFNGLAQLLWKDCPADPEDMAKDMETMQCEFDNSKGGSKESGSKGN